MEISICGKKLADCLSDEDASRKRYGQRMTAIIFRRLAQLLASSTLETMRNIGRCHELKGDRAGCFALDLVHPQRMIFKPDGNKEEYLENGSIIWKKVTKVEIIDIEDYH